MDIRCVICGRNLTDDEKRSRYPMKGWIQLPRRLGFACDRHEIPEISRYIHSRLLGRKITLTLKPPGQASLRFGDEPNCLGFHSLYKNKNPCCILPVNKGGCPYKTKCLQEQELGKMIKVKRNVREKRD